MAVITVDSAFQIHPVIATRWAGNLGKKSKKLIMIMVGPPGQRHIHIPRSQSCPRAI